jgi:hypothetical protein
VRLKIDEAEDKPLTVKDLREHLEQFPDNMEVVYSCCSQWTKMHRHEVSTLEGFDNGGYISQSFRPKDQALVKTFLAFPGN